MGKKKKKPTKSKYVEILINALVDLIVGTLLIIIGKLIDYVSGVGEAKTSPYTYILQNIKAIVNMLNMKDFLISLGVILICFAVAKFVYWLIKQTKEK